MLHELQPFLFADALPEFVIVEQGATAQGVPYDYMSIMHFTETQFSVNGNATLQLQTTKEAHMGARDYPNCLDYFHVILLYCEGKLNHIISYGIAVLVLLTLSFPFTKCKVLKSLQTCTYIVHACV